MRGGRDRDAKKIMKATGAGYQVALNEMQRRTQIGQIKVYMTMVKSTPDWVEGQPTRCVRCLAPEHGKCEI